MSKIEKAETKADRFYNDTKRACEAVAQTATRPLPPLTFVTVSHTKPDRPGPRG